MNPRNVNEDYSTYENNADAWWNQLDLDKERQAEELKAIHDRQQQLQPHKETSHDQDA